MEEDELLDLFIDHGCFLYFHQGKIDQLSFRIIEIQEIDFEAAHTGGSLYPDLDRKELFSPTYYSDGIAFSSSTQSVGGRYIYQETFRLGILEEIEKNKRFGMRGINEAVGVIVGRGCHIDFTIAE